jgi:hypothetical protein
MLIGYLALTDAANAGPDTRALLVKWNGLHAVRTALGALATATLIFALASVSDQ